MAEQLATIEQQKNESVLQMGNRLAQWEAAVSALNASAAKIGEAPEVTDEASADAAKKRAKELKAEADALEKLRKEVTGPLNDFNKRLIEETRNASAAHYAAVEAIRGNLTAWQAEQERKAAEERARIEAERQAREAEERKRLALIDQERGRLSKLLSEFLAEITSSDVPAELEVPEFKVLESVLSEITPDEVVSMTLFCQGKEVNAFEYRDLMVASFEKNDPQEVQKARALIFDRAGMHRERAQLDEIRRRQQAREEEEERKAAEAAALAELEERKQLATSRKIADIQVIDLMQIPAHLYEVKFNLNAVKAYWKENGNLPGAKVTFEENATLR